MKRKAILNLVLIAAMCLALSGTIKVTKPSIQQTTAPVAPLKIGIMAQSAMDGQFSHTVVLSRAGHPVSGAKVKCGSVLLTESTPGTYTGSSNIPVYLGQAVSFSIIDGLGASYSATATIKNIARFVKPGNGEVINRTQGTVAVQWRTLAAGSAPVYFLVYAAGVSSSSYSFKQDNVTGGKFNFPLGGVPAAATGLTFHVFFPSLGGMSANDFTFSGNVTPDSQGNVSLYDKVFVYLK
jgi:hypothetical protein